MKKLERLLDKLIGNKRPGDIIKELILLVELIVFTIIGINLATSYNIYILLSIVAFMLVGVIKESFIKKELFKKLNNYLRETPKATALIFFIICIIIFVLSWRYFISVIFSAILAVMFTDYIDN